MNSLIQDNIENCGTSLVNSMAEVSPRRASNLNNSVTQCSGGPDYDGSCCSQTAQNLFNGFHTKMENMDDECDTLDLGLPEHLCP